MVWSLPTELSTLQMTGPWSELPFASFTRKRMPKRLLSSWLNRSKCLTRSYKEVIDDSAEVGKFKGKKYI